MAMTPTERWTDVKRLRRDAPRDRVLRFGAALFCLLGLASWFLLEIELRHPITGKSRFALKPSFLDDVVPLPWRDGSREFGALLDWIAETCAQMGWQTVLDTVALSVLAIVLAALLALPTILPAARNVILLESFLPADRELSRLESLLRHLIHYLTRALLVIWRAVPEFIWAFILLIALGPVALAGVFALAIHNAGILGKLTSEAVEDMEHRPGRALSALGATRASVALVATAPRVWPQFLVYFFYRWETCVRETAILGVLAIHTIGFHIKHSFAFFQYDRAMVFLLVNSFIVIGGDLLGARVRRGLRTKTNRDA